jgi:hypothetical protein
MDERSETVKTAVTMTAVKALRQQVVQHLFCHHLQGWC